jgi:hopanoid-associated phosphorylase
MATEPRPVVVVCGLAFEAAIAAGPQVQVVCATGAGAAAARLERALAHEARGCRAIISFGCAAALDPALRPGACVLAGAVVTPGGTLGTDAGWVHALSGCLPGAVQGRLAGVELPLLDRAAKAHLWRTSGACAADMESHEVARIARLHGVPFVACRVVLDPAWRALPSIALAGLRDDGATALGPLLGALARRPWQLPALAALALDAHAARRSLREARVRAGPAFAAP